MILQTQIGLIDLSGNWNTYKMCSGQDGLYRTEDKTITVRGILRMPPSPDASNLEIDLPKPTKINTKKPLVFTYSI